MPPGIKTGRWGYTPFPSNNHDPKAHGMAGAPSPFYIAAVITLSVVLIAVAAFAI